MTDYKKEPVYAKNVLEMITVAHEFCLFIEAIEDYTKEDLLQYLQKICPLLYLKGTLLPRISVLNEDANERFVTEEQWETIFLNLRKKLSPDDEYRYIDTKLSPDHDPINASVSDNLADVYQDLKDFVILYQKASRDAKENAVSECKILFESHWGTKILNVQRIIHNLLYKNIDTEDYSFL